LTTYANTINYTLEYANLTELIPQIFMKKLRMDDNISVETLQIPIHLPVALKYCDVAFKNGYSIELEI
jgi:hypothetical protein